jgi:hypothetical protein
MLMKAQPARPDLPGPVTASSTMRPPDPRSVLKKLPPRTAPQHSISVMGRDGGVARQSHAAIQEPAPPCRPEDRGFGGRLVLA